LGGYGGFYGFYGRGYRIFIKINYFIKIFYNNTYAEAHYKKKSRGSQENIIRAEIMGGFVVCTAIFVCMSGFRGAGGGEVSGGGTHYM
jgi:hypothetical protein